MAGAVSPSNQQRLVTGVIVLLGLVALGAYMTYQAYGRRALADRVEVVVVMHEVGELAAGAPISQGGVTIGTVEAIGFEGTMIQVRGRIRRQVLAVIPADSTARPDTIGLVGDTFLDIVPGCSREVLASRPGPPYRIKAEPPASLDTLYEHVESIGEKAESILKGVDAISGSRQMKQDQREVENNLDRIKQQSVRLVDTVRALSEYFGEEGPLFAETGESIARVRDEVKGFSGRTLGDPENKVRIEEIQENIDRLTTRVGAAADGFKQISADLDAAGKRFGEIAGAFDDDKGLVPLLFEKSDPASLGYAIESAKQAMAILQHEAGLSDLMVINKFADRAVIPFLRKHRRQDAMAFARAWMRHAASEKAAHGGHLPDPKGKDIRDLIDIAPAQKK